MNGNWDPNAFIVCPYDNLHVISVKRYQHHIIKCRKNHPGKDYGTCPFNAKHIVLRPQLKSHIAHCPDRVVLEYDILKDSCLETGEVFRLKGKTEIPRGNYSIPDADEDWDFEIEENITQKYEEQALESRRKYEEHGLCLRRPYNAEVNGSFRRTYEDDCNSVTSFSSRTSSLYVDPVKWNESDHHESTAAKTNSLSNTHAPSLDQKNSIGRGKNFATTKPHAQRDVKRNPRGVSVNPIDDPIRKPFGRGTLLKTLENYHQRKDK